MRVLHVYSGNLFGGIETMLRSVARHSATLTTVSHEFALCFDGRLATELRALGASVHLLTPVKVSRPQTICQARRRLAALLGAGSFDAVVVHAPWSHALFGPVIRATGVPLAFWSHDAWSGRHWIERWAQGTVPDLVFANSAFTAATIAPVYPHAPQAVVHPPIEVGGGRIHAGERLAVRRDLSTPPSALVVVQASRMEAWKGHATLLRALAAVRDDPRWVCWFAGGAQRPKEHAYVASLRRLVADLGIADRVRFAGERRDVPRLLAAADICCQPNLRAEPFGVVFVEALAAGLPVVTAGLGGALEIVDDTCGRLVPPGDVAALREALAALMGDAALRARLGAAGSRRAAQVCDPARQLGRLADALASIARVALAG